MQKTKIEWCDSSFNPITGCYHDCPYCYARRTAMRFKGCDDCPSGDAPGKIITLSHRLTVTNNDGVVRNAAYPFGFTPTLHEYRLNDLKKNGYGKTVFVCSMSDMFGAWVPDEWIERVFKACEESERHRYLFLTKNPARYLDLDEAGKLPKNPAFWYGSTVTGPEVPAFYGKGYNTFISVEPVLESFDGEHTDDLAKNIGWVILGAESGNRKDKVVPEKSWVEPLVKEFQDAGKPVFMKDSMVPVWGEDIITQFPWDGE